MTKVLPTVAAAGMLFASAAGAAPANSVTTDHAAVTAAATTATVPTDLSAQRRHYRYVRNRWRVVRPYPSYGYYGPRPQYYRPYPFYLPFPFGFGFGYDPYY